MARGSQEDREVKTGLGKGRGRHVRGQGLFIANSGQDYAVIVQRHVRTRGWLSGNGHLSVSQNLEQVPKILADSWCPSSVIPANAGIQVFQYVLDPGFRRGDDQGGQSVPDKIMVNRYN
jgi:hypothetical protein